MPRKPSPQPTEVELAILRALWDAQRPAPAKHPGLTVREVHDALAAHRDTGYSTTLKMMQVMHEKGLLTRDDSLRPQRYRPALAEAQTQRDMVNDLIDRAFGGSAANLVMRAVEGRVSPDELDQIKRLLRDTRP
jgi:BlaI family transcriptional regulator, penicillinase repressor